MNLKDFCSSVTAIISGVIASAAKQSSSVLDCFAALAMTPVRLSIIALCLSFPLSAKQADLTSVNKELKTVQQKISSLRDTIADDQKLIAAYQNELKKHEVNIGQINNKISTLSSDLTNKQLHLDELTGAFIKVETATDQQLEQLSKELQTSFFLGQKNNLKILFNLENPTQLARTLRYLGYIHQTRASQIAILQEQLEETALLQNEIQQQKYLIETELEEQRLLLEQSKQEKDNRRQLVSAIEKTLNQHGNQLNNMVKNQQDLSKTIDALQKKLNQEMPNQIAGAPFTSQKGKLGLPVNGKTLYRFGENRSNTQLKSQGIFVSAPTGSSVNAIHNGKIIYADWLRGFGLLIIVDHGNGYMSLYAHNQDLLKRKGDWVKANETIAHVGNSGGLAETGLYFEIRYKGQPINPSPWLRS